MLDFFNGIKVYIYDNDHNPPHFHAICNEYRALIEIDTLAVLAGELPPAQLKKVRQWAKGQQPQLRAEFERINPNPRNVNPA